MSNESEIQDFFRPALASPPSEFTALGGLSPTEMVETLTGPSLGPEFVFDVKWDGVRCMAMKRDGEIVLRNRNNVLINERYPDVVAAFAAATEHLDSVMLDGEVVVFDEDGRPDFGLVARRDRVKSEEKARAVMKKLPATFIAFDLLRLNGDSFAEGAWAGRRAMLEAHFTNGPLFIVSPVSADGNALWGIVTQLGGEGLIAKDVTGEYHSGSRMKSWIKIKDTRRVSCIVTGIQAGTGKQAGKMGALHLAMLGKQGDLVPVGKVGTGFKDRDREDWQIWWDKKDQPFDPLSSVFSVEVEFLNVTPDGVLRFPSYKGMRMDMKPQQCSVDQLERT